MHTRSMGMEHTVSASVSINFFLSSAQTCYCLLLVTLVELARLGTFEMPKVRLGASGLLMSIKTSKLVLCE